MKRTIKGQFQGVCGVIVETTTIETDRESPSVSVKSVEFFAGRADHNTAYLTPAQARRLAGVLTTAADEAGKNR